MKMPPFLLLTTLMFWGWQSNLLAAGVVMGIVFEGARFIKVRWELSDADFRSILTFCTILAFTAALYAFTSNEPGGGLGSLFSGSRAVHNASVAGLLASSAFFRWLPITMFLFILSHVFSTRERLPWTAVSIYAHRRWKRAAMSGNPIPAGGGLNVPYAYFILCLFSAGIHPNEGGLSFFWGLCVLIIWALWPVRSRRYGISAWALALAAVIGLGFAAQLGIFGLGRIVEGAEPGWLSRFARHRADPMQATTAIGQIGELELSSRIAIRVWTDNNEPPPTYLREASYRVFYSARESWYAGRPHTDFQTIPSEKTNETSWVLLPGKTNTGSASLACYLDGGRALLPLPTGSGRLDNLNAYVLQQNSEGAVLAEGPGLAVFDARYGPGATADSPPSPGTNSLDLMVPANEVPALQQVISQLNLTGQDERQTLQKVFAFFQDNFKYSIWQPPDKTNHSANLGPLAQFLLTRRTGHCEYFATATVLLLRELKIPARYAVGYLVHEKHGSEYVVRDRDAHAWCLVWDERAREWEDFDTTPASWVAEEGQRASPWQWLSDSWSWLEFQIAKLRWGETNLRYYILWGLVPVLGLLLYQIVFRHGRRRQQPVKAARKDPIFRPGLDSEFYLLEARLTARGVPRQEGESLLAWLERALEEPALADMRRTLQELLQLHYRHRFDPLGLSQLDRERLAQDAKSCLETLSTK